MHGGWQWTCDNKMQTNHCHWASGLKFTRARGHSNELGGTTSPTPSRQFEHWFHAVPFRRTRENTKTHTETTTERQTQRRQLMADTYKSRVCVWWRPASVNGQVRVSGAWKPRSATDAITRHGTPTDH